MRAMKSRLMITPNIFLLHHITRKSSAAMKPAAILLACTACMGVREHDRDVDYPVIAKWGMQVN